MLYQFNDTVSWTKGPHSFKFGVNLSSAPMRNIFQDEPGTRGDFPSPAYSPDSEIRPGSRTTRTGCLAHPSIRS